MADISVDAFDSRLLASIFLLTEGRDIGRLRLVCKGWQQNIDELQVRGTDIPHSMALDMRSSLCRINETQVQPLPRRYRRSFSRKPGGLPRH